MNYCTKRFYFEHKNKRSTQWRIWDNNEDLYISSRQIGSIFKASLHESSTLNFSFTGEYFYQDEERIDPMPKERHLGSQILEIDDTKIQIVFYILVPIEWMSNCKYYRSNKACKINIADMHKGTIAVKIIHVPDFKRESIIEDEIENLIGAFCNKKYIVVWNVDSTKELNDYGTKTKVELGDISYDEDTRAITFGFQGVKAGFFLDTKAKNE